jgi:4-amino-4-deoxy-L-arabinose transferase-like glycosyltransferase
MSRSSLTTVEVLGLQLRQISQRYPYLCLILWGLPLLVLSSAQQSLMAHDEGIYAYQARQIVEGGNWLRPGGDFNYDRAIGIQWIIALCFQLWGQQEWIARLPSTIGAIVALGLTYRIGCKLLNPSLAFKGALILGVTPLFVQYGRLATQDMVLVAIELVGIWAFLEGEIPAVRAPQDSASTEALGTHTQRSRALWGALGAATFGLGFLIKGFMIIPVGIAFAPYLIIGQRRHHYLTTLAVYVGALMGLIPAAVWIGLSVQRYGLLPIDGLFGKLFALSQDTFNGNGPLFYLWNIPANAFPWFFFSLWGMVILGQKLRQTQHFLANPGHRWIVLGYPLLLLLELICFKTRTRYYPLQLLPFFSLWGAIGLENLLQACRSFSPSRWLLGLSYGWGGFALLLMGLGMATRLPLPITEDPMVQVYGTIAFGMGLGWSLVPLALLGAQWTDRGRIDPKGEDLRAIDREHTGRRTIVSPRPLLWAMGWLLGSWLGLALFGITGVWGDYNPELKAFLTRPHIQSHLAQHLIYPVANPPQATANNRKIGLLLQFYVPHLGPKLPSAADLQPQDYAWLPPTVADPPHAYHTLGTVKGWRLIQVCKDATCPP